MKKHHEKKNTLDMSLKKFKHVKSTHDATTLQHQDGHILTIAHKNLSPDTKGQLQALAKMSSQDATPEQANEMQDQKMARGGRAHYDDGGGIGDVVSKIAPIAMMALKDGGELESPSTNMNAPQSARQDFADESARRDQDTQRHGQATSTVVPQGTTKMKAGQTQQFAQGGETSQPPDENASADRNMSQAPQDRAADDFRPEMVQTQTQAQAPVEQQEDPMVTAYKDSYDKQVSNSLAMDPYMSPESRAAYTFKGAGQGKMPAGFDPNIAQAAIQDTHKQLAANDAAKTAQNSANIQLQGMAAKFGIDPSTVGQTPLASPGPEVPGSQQNPAPQNPSVLPNMDKEGKPLPANQQGMPDDLQSAQNVGLRGIGMQEAGNVAGAKAMGQKGEAEAAALTQMATADQTLREGYKKSYDEIDGELKASMKDMQNGEVDPEAFWHGHKNAQTGQMEGGHSKIAAAIGILIGGFNPTDRPNAGLEMINQRINQNIQAQVTNLNSKNNLVRANLEHYHNLNQAMEATRLMLNQQAQHMVSAASAKFAGPIAAANAQALNGQLEQQKGQMMAGFAMTHMMYNLGGNKNMSPDDQMAAYTRGIQMFRARGDMDKAKDLESHVVPGVGISPNQSVPESAKTALAQHRDVNNLMNQSLDFSEKYGGANWFKYSPTQRAQIMAQASTIQNQLIGQLKQVQHDGVFKPSEAQFLLGQIGTNPASFMANFSSVPKIKEVQQIGAQAYGNMAKSYGIDNYKPLDTYAPVVMHKGIPVRKGPDGNYHRVK